MDYQEFIQAVIALIQQKVGDDAHVMIKPLLKTNCNEIESLCICYDGSNIFPAIYMPPYFKLYNQGTSIEKIAERIMEFDSDHNKRERYDISYFTDYDLVKDRIIYRIINYDSNMELLSQVPHKKFLDLAAVYYYSLEDKKFGDANILIRNEHLEMWEIDQDMLDRDAYGNTLRMNPPDFLSCSTLLITAGLLPEIYAESLPDMYLLTNTLKTYGAAMLLYPSILKDIGNQLNADYYVLPSSVHECIILPAAGEFDPYELQKIVVEVNKECVATEEVLGDNVYRYFVEKGCLEIVATQPGDKLRVLLREEPE